MAAIDWGTLAVEQHRIPVNGVTLAVTVAGDGPALVLLHGIGSGAGSWLAVAEQLAREFKLVIIELRGHGNSGWPESGFLLTDYASDLDGVLEALKIEHPLILGHSLGGMTTLQWAIAHPDRAAALLIEDSPMRRGGPDTADLFDGWIMLSASSVDEAAAWYARENPGWSAADCRRRAEAITSVAPGVFREMKADMVPQGGAIVTDQYRGIQSPTLLVFGDITAGGMVPESDSRAFTDALADATAMGVSGGSHNLHRDRPEAFLAIALPFLREHAAKASTF